MPTQGPPSRPMAAPLAHRIADEASAEQVAAAFASLVIEIDAALAPVIGARGVAALCRRSLHLAAATHPWLLGSAGHTAAATFDAAATAALLAQRADAAVAAALYFQTFHDLLATLIGASLTERLLRTVWGPPTGFNVIAPAQDPSP